MLQKRWLLVGLVALAAACNNSSNNKPSSTDTANVPATPTVTAPTFDADSAYDYVAKQVAFGPRIPGTPAQQKCADWLIAKMKSYADTVYMQKTTVTVPGGKNVPCINIIASFNPAAKQRILLVAHWDTRPFADEEKANPTAKIDGADDGGSGVAVAMEAARQMKAKNPGIGVDILLNDVEDYGDTKDDNTFCLGTQYWAKNPHIPGYTANYGIGLDMVGAKGARFFMEAVSKQYANRQMMNFWNAGNTVGFSSYFPYDDIGAGTTDDHLYVNTIAKIPTFDVIAFQSNANFLPHWHTTKDNMDVIDKNTLKAVGQTLLQVLYVQPFNY
ncbi:peptidase M28-like protein [Chitinophaga skermanii]|uniref:Peptidase M28-like protein n=1 Tax=Chitinophaga skermanii TaxID=331697 RepID=A0A327Q320_9BACT|nr:M28 family peptidase [Chitinophaga skermanii]RAI98759.1 peptidase M28-like protein [Chitinophaga skermanii]